MKNDKIEVVIITGMSGAGKTVAIQSLEDLGYYCMDNLPPILISKVSDLFLQSLNKNRKLAIVLDLRGGEFFDYLMESIEFLEENENFDSKIIFLDASNEVLVRRYKETRRNHPLSDGGPPLRGVEIERSKLKEVQGKATQYIDTSQLKPKELIGKIYSIFDYTKQDKFTMNFVSFGFKYGVPIDADIVFDVRFLVNPFYDKELKVLTGLDQRVSKYVMKDTNAQRFLEKLVDMLDFLIQPYIEEGKSQIAVAIGCTGGKHRSVTIVEQLNEIYKDSQQTIVTHRDIEKNKSYYKTVDN